MTGPLSLPPSPSPPPFDSPAASGRCPRVRSWCPERATEGSESKGKTPAAYYVYILRCADGTLYSGSTNDLAAREEGSAHRP